MKIINLSRSDSTHISYKYVRKCTRTKKKVEHVCLTHKKRKTSKSWNHTYTHTCLRSLLKPNEKDTGKRSHKSDSQWMGVDLFCPSREDDGHLEAYRLRLPHSTTLFVWSVFSPNKLHPFKSLWLVKDLQLNDVRKKTHLPLDLLR